MPNKLSGTIKEIVTLVPRTVRLLNRTTGELIDSVDSVDGNFEFTRLATNDQVQLVCLDDAAGTTYNDLIYRVAPVVYIKEYTLTIDYNDIDDDLIDFPITIPINDSVGTNGLDLSSLVSTNSWLNISVEAPSVADPDIYEPCSIEVEFWDSVNKKGLLHAKIPKISSTEDTIVKLITGEENSNIGVTGSAIAQTVWDENFAAVYTMAQDPSGGAGCILDSTSNANHGTPNGSMTSGDLVDGLTGKAIEFDGNDDYILLDSNLILPTECTVDIIHNQPASSAEGLEMIFEQRSTSTTGGRFLSIKPNAVGIYNTGLNYDTGGSFTPLSVIRSSGKCDIYLDGDYVGEYTSLNDAMPNRPATIAIRTKDTGSVTTTDCFDGAIECLRISNTMRSVAWVKATNDSLRNQLFTIE